MGTWDDNLKKAMERAWSAPQQPFVGLADKEAEKQDRDRFPQAMIEGSTEYDWAELPDWLKDVMRQAAAEFRRWDDIEPIAGEVVTAQYEVEASRNPSNPHSG